MRDVEKAFARSAVLIREKGEKMTRYIDRDKALSFPFANGQYDHENANEHFIFGCEAYKEWLETLPTVNVPDRKD